jgi:hypothetical protein
VLPRLGLDDLAPGLRLGHRGPDASLHVELTPAQLLRAVARLTQASAPKRD